MEKPLEIRIMDHNRYSLGKRQHKDGMGSWGQYQRELLIYAKISNLETLHRFSITFHAGLWKKRGSRISALPSIFEEGLGPFL